MFWIVRQTESGAIEDDCSIYINCAVEQRKSVSTKKEMCQKENRSVQQEIHTNKLNSVYCFQSL